MIDDSLTHCDAASEKGISTLLFSSKANQYEETEHIRVSNWEEVIDENYEQKYQIIFSMDNKAVFLSNPPA